MTCSSNFICSPIIWTSRNWIMLVDFAGLTPLYTHIYTMLRFNLYELTAWPHKCIHTRNGRTRWPVLPWNFATALAVALAAIPTVSIKYDHHQSSKHQNLPKNREELSVFTISSCSDVENVWYLHDTSGQPSTWVGWVFAPACCGAFAWKISSEDFARLSIMGF